MLFLLLLFNFVLTSTADEFLEERIELTSSMIENNNEFQKNKDFSENEKIEHVLDKIVQMSALVENPRQEKIHTTANTEEQYDEIVDLLQDLINLLKTPENAHKFLNIKGVDSIKTLIIGTNNERLKKQVLILMKSLFYIAPSTTISKMPLTMVDKLLDIFEHDENLALKTHALDIMYVWLPNNPLVQARVMKVKGLEPFYDQVSKLGSTVIYTLLDLFNRILEEHIKARDDTSSEIYNKNLYQQIGLIERMSTPPVCTGLLNIFELISPFNQSDEQFSKLIIDLMMNIKPFCLTMYNNKSRSIKIFTELKNYFIHKMDLLVKLGFNPKEVVMLLEDYTKKLNDISRDEF